PHRRLPGHAVQPGGHRLPRHGRRLADEDEERGLECVLGIVVIVEEAAADPQTIGACRRTRAARASPSRLPRKRAKSSPSVIPAPSGPVSAKRCWRTTLNGLVGIDSYLARTAVSPSLSSERAVLIHQFDDGPGA